MAFQGVDIRQTGDRIVFRVLVTDATGALVTTGTANLRIYELQNDGTVKSYDFSSNTFKTTALTTETQALTHRTGNNSTFSTGLWTYALTTLSGFTAGNLYFAHVSHTSMAPATQAREFQFGVASAFDPFDGVRGGLTALPTTTLMIKKNTAFPNFTVPMVASSDHTSLATGKTVTATRRIDAGSFAACANLASEVGTTGVYTIDFAGSDVNGAVITFMFTAPGCDPQLFLVVTVP